MTPRHPSLRAATLLLAIVGCTRDLTLPPLPGPGTVYGTVVYAVPGQAAPVPAPNAVVSLLGTSLQTTASSDGHFLLQGLVTSEGSLLFQVDSTGSGAFDHQRLVSLSDIGAGVGRQIAMGDVVVGANAQMHGRVVLGDRANQPGGQGGSTVFVPSAQYTSTTGDDGSWTLDDLPEGSVIVSIFHPAYRPQSVGPIDLRSNEDFGVSDIVLAPAPGSQQSGTIGGTVAFVPSLPSAAGTTVAAATGASAFVSAQTDPSGSFQLTGLSPGLYTVAAEHVGYATASIPNVLVQSGVESVLPVIVLGTGTGGDGGFVFGTDGGGIGPNGGVIANPGPPGAVAAGATYTLDGTGSSAQSGGPLFYAWSQTAGDPVTLSLNDSVVASRPSFTAPLTPQDLSFQLTVSNAAGSATAATVVTVTLPPTARVIPNLLTLHPNERAVLDGSGSSDPTGSELTFQWSVVDGGALIESDGGPTATVTAPGASTSSSLVQLVVTNGFVASAPFPVPVVVGSPPIVNASAGPQQFVPTASVVVLSGAATSTDPNDTFTFQWSEQDGGVPVALVNASTPMPTFVAPAVPAMLTFDLTATASSGGTATASVNVVVVDETSPLLTLVSPNFSGGTGSSLFARAVSNQPLDPTTVTGANAAILDASGQTVPSSVFYDPRARTVDVVPSSPLTAGQSYVFSVGAVANTSGIAHIPWKAPYTVGQLAWTFWGGPMTGSPPDPGVAVGYAGPVVAAFANIAGCGGGTWFLTPGDAGALVTEPPCVGISTGSYETLGRRAVTATDAVFALQQITGNALYQEAGPGWLALSSAPYAIGSDGISVLGMTAYNLPLSFGEYDPACTAGWCFETVEASQGWDPYRLAAVGGNGRLFAAGTQLDAGNNALRVFERLDAGNWTELTQADAGRPPVAQGVSAIPMRLAFAHGDPFVAYSSQTGISQVAASSWSSATGAWTQYGSQGAGSSFDVYGRGNAVYLAEILANELRLKWMDLGAQSPAFQDIQGPNGLALNTCPAAHPELFVTDDSVWLTWYELCPGGAYQVFLGRLN
jgi:hypothetical protein